MKPKAVVLAGSNPRPRCNQTTAIRFLDEVLAKLDAPVEYRSILSDLLGWIIERAGGASFAQLFSQQIWSRIGAECDASIAVDRGGCPVTDGEISVTLRDLGRFGLMHLNDGVVDERRVLPAAWIERLLRPDAELSAAFGGALEVHGVTGPDTMYHDQWWVLDPTRGTCHRHPRPDPADPPPQSDGDRQVVDAAEARRSRAISLPDGGINRDLPRAVRIKLT